MHTETECLTSRMQSRNLEASPQTLFGFFWKHWKICKRENGIHDVVLPSVTWMQHAVATLLKRTGVPSRFDSANTNHADSARSLVLKKPMEKSFSAEAPRARHFVFRLNSTHWIETKKTQLVLEVSVLLFLPAFRHTTSSSALTFYLKRIGGNTPHPRHSFIHDSQGS